jgi:hypothetical protein
LAEYNLGIGKFQRRDATGINNYDLSDEEPDMRLPDRPYVPLRPPRQ